mgnify:CR=1 FL=1
MSCTNWKESQEYRKPEQELENNKDIKFDVILDDGTHKMQDQQVSLGKLFKKLKFNNHLSNIIKISRQDITYIPYYPISSIKMYPIIYLICPNYPIFYIKTKYF